MNVVCAWCKKQIGTKEPLQSEETTHGICPECLKKVGGHHASNLDKAVR